jgi:DNA-directed RNA polymerase subunit beta'
VTIGFQVGALIQVRDGQDVGPGEVLAHPGRRPEDPRHHRRSAARGRAVRSPHAQGQGHAGRDDRHRVLRQGNQGQDPPADHRPGRQGLGRAGAQGKEHPGARRPGGEQGRVHRRRSGRSAGHPAPAGHRRAGALHRRRGAGRVPPAGREDQRQAHRSDRAPDAAPRRGREPRRVQLHRRRAGRAQRNAQHQRGAAGRGQDPATYSNVLLGITKASLSTDSFISAASFQEPRAC